MSRKVTRSRRMNSSSPRISISLKTYLLRPLVGNHIFGCDICRQICPYNVKVRPTSEPAYAPRAGLYAPDLIPLLALTEQEFRRRFRRSPILRAKRRGFLGNVAVALGNIGNAESVPALIHALNDEEPLVRGHAAWALGRIGTAEAIPGLRRRLSIEEDIHVRAEIEEAISDAEKNCSVVSDEIYC